MRIKKIASFVFLILFNALCLGQTAADTDLATQQKLAEKFNPSMVVVEYHLKYDKGQSPRCDGLSEYCSSCGSYHSLGDVSEYIIEERPLLNSGYVLDNNKVITSDIQIDMRFIEKIMVRKGQEAVEAKVWGYYQDSPSLLLSVANMPGQAKPIEFTKKTSDELFSIDYVNQLTRWNITVNPFSPTFSRADDGSIMRVAKNTGLIVDADGNALTVYSGTAITAVDDSWLVSPLAMNIVNNDTYNALLKKTENTFKATVLPCLLNFRSPAKKASDYARSYMSEQEGNATERYCYAIVVAPDRIMIPVNLNADKTARLEKITVTTSDGKQINATFESSNRDYGFFTATTTEKFAQTTVLAKDNILNLQGKLMPVVEIEVQGEDLVCRYLRNRIMAFQYGWKQMVMPVVSGAEYGMYDEQQKTTLVYNPTGELVVLPVSRRLPSAPDRYGYSSSDSQALLMTATCELTKYLAAPQEYAAADIVPLSAELENRAAWLGVILQSLNADLARLNKVAEFTENGTVGALVSYVYPDSPAQRAGIEPGMILVRVQSKDNNKPYNIMVDEQLSEYMGNFPWDRLDEVPAEYMERIPTPWPAVEDEVGQIVREFGFGKDYTAEFYRDGKRVDIDLKVEQAPTSYDTAKKSKSDSLGLTVRQLTFEVRRYMQLSESDPGVIISKVEPGSKSDVAELKCFELITHINDKPISDIEQFEAAIKDATEIQFTIKRMSKGRVVKITL